MGSSPSSDVFIPTSLHLPFGREDPVSEDFQGTREERDEAGLSDKDAWATGLIATMTLVASGDEKPGSAPPPRASTTRGKPNRVLVAVTSRAPATPADSSWLAKGGLLLDGEGAGPESLNCK